MIRGDSTDYDLLEKWTKGFDCQGYKSCEIGVREGLGSKIIMDNVINNYIHVGVRSEEHTSELQSRLHLVCRLLLEKKKNHQRKYIAQHNQCFTGRKRC